MPIQKTHKRFLPVLMVVMAALSAMSPLAIDTYIAALPDIANTYSVGLNIAELTITLYFLGFALGNFIGGPLSDSFGRKTVALIGVALYGLSAFFIPLCNSIEYVLVLRVLMAFGGGFGTVTTNIFVRDWFDGKQVARFITTISMIMILAPLLAPVIGAGLIEWKGWQAVFIFLFIFAIILFFSLAFLIPESRKAEHITRKLTLPQLFSKYRDFFSNKQSVIMLFAISLPMSGMYIFITSASFIYIEYFDIPRIQFPIFFGANILLNIIFSLANNQLLKKYRPTQILRVGLLIQFFAALLLATVVLTTEPKIWIVFSGIVLYVGSLGLVFGNGTATILNYNPEVAGSANATIGIMRFLLSAVIGSLMVVFHTGDLIPFGIILLLLSLSGNTLLHIVLRNHH